MKRSLKETLKKVINNSIRNKDSFRINLDLVGITAESTLNFFDNFLPNTLTVADIDLLSSLTRHPEPTVNAPMPGINIIAETKSFRKFERIEIDNLKNGTILETERNINMRFQKELATFKNNCEKIITSYENSKIHVENLEKEIRRKDNMIDQLLLDPKKISAQSTRHPQAALFKQWSFPLKIPSVNVAKSAGNCGLGHIYWGKP